MREIVSNPGLVAYCGLYCGACRAYLKEGCPGCHDNQKASWCKIRSCCIDEGLATCVDCKQFSDPNDCKKFNNVVAKVFSLLFRSNRAACLRQVRDLGIQGHADNMSRLKRPTIRR
ncbi:MAG: DUF3795 domain-containing protein [Thermodesulfobacteriota bacterium]